MKKILVINGSPNKKGHTKNIVEKVLSTIDTSKADIINVDCYKKQIMPCVDCKGCSHKIGQCSIKDDMDPIYDYLKNCDIIILASPMYFGMFPAPLKAIMDRCQLIWSEKYIFNKTTKPKKGILIFDGGTEWKNMYMPMETIAKYFFNTLNCTIEYKLFIANTDKDHHYLENNAASILSCQETISNLLEI